MLQYLYRGSFFLYEIGFILFALALGTQGELLRKLTRTLRLPPYWIFCSLSAVLMLLCALIHFYVYHYLSPQYLLSVSQEKLLLMYWLKTVSMGSIFIAGVSLVLGCGLYLKKTTH